MKHVVVVGGGIAGLAAAYRLHTRAPWLALTLVEAGDRLGGKIVSERIDDFVIEGGPDSFLAFKPRGVGLCRELGLEDQLQGTNPAMHGSFVLRDGELHELPEGLTGLIPTRLGPIARSKLFSLRGKLRMGLDVLLPARRDDHDESLASFVRRRLGNEAYEWLIGPLMSGIYAGDGEALSLNATFPQLRDIELKQGSLVRGMLAARNNGAVSKRGQQHSAFVTPRGGLGEIIAALESELRSIDIRLRTRAMCLNADAGGYVLTLENNETLRADTIVLATPAFASAELLIDLDAQLAYTLHNTPYVSTATLSLGYRRADVRHALNGYGYIVPRAEGRSILACTWTSSKFMHRAAEDHVLIRVFIGRSGQEHVLERSDQDLLRLARDELRTTLSIDAEPVLSRIFRWPKAMPQYTLGHLDRLALIEQRLAEYPGIYLAGNAYRGIGIPDCIASGEAAADQIIAREMAR